MKTYTKNSPEIQALCDSDTRLALVIWHYGDLTYTIDIDPFTHIIKNIIGQMLSRKAANAVVSRLYSLCNNVLTPYTIGHLDMLALRNIGISRQKAEYIMQMASLLREQPDYFKILEFLSDDEIIKRLTMLRGIGAWSAKMYLIFVLDRLDILPYEDGAFLQVYKWLYATDEVNPASIKERCAPWSPYSSIAARYMYRALDNGLIKDAKLNAKLAKMNSNL